MRLLLDSPRSRTSFRQKTKEVSRDKVIRIDPSLLIPHTHHFNCSLIEYRNKMLLAYRAGKYAASIYVAELGNNYQPIKNVCLYPSHQLCHAASEDPRLFIHKGRLYCGFIGVQVDKGKMITHQLIARLADSLEIEETLYLEYDERASWEKNWTFFEWEGELFAVYSIKPHIILHLTGSKAHFFTRSDSDLKWSAGVLRGGSSPVLHRDEFYCFFHGAIEKDGRRHYSTGCYTFSPKPPFRILRITPEPIQVPRDLPEKGPSVVFVCGAIIKNHRWLLSYGYHDQWCEIEIFEEDEIERKLKNA